MHNDQLTEPEIVFPPPPKTVEIWNPHTHEMVSVFAYGHRRDVDEPLQRVRWNPSEGRWEVDPERAKWGRQTGNSKATTPWTLITIWPEDMKPSRGPSKTQRRLDELERQVEFLMKSLGCSGADLELVEEADAEVA